MNSDIHGSVAIFDWKLPVICELPWMPGDSEAGVILTRLVSADHTPVYIAQNASARKIIVEYL